MKKTPDEWPMLTDYEDDESVVLHPFLEVLKAGNKLEGITVVHDWTDDHEICLAIRATVNGKTYEYSDWWLSREGYKLYVKAEESQKFRDKLVKEHLSYNWKEAE